MRSFARARSSSRRAPPIAASNWCSSIASSSVVVCNWLRDARGPVCSCTRPLSIDAWTLATTRRSPSSATRRSRYSITSGKLWPVSTCMTGNGNFAGRNAFSANRSITIESLPPEKSSTGRSRSAATSRMMWIASDSSSSRCESVRRETERLMSPAPRRAGRTRCGRCPPSGRRDRRPEASSGCRRSTRNRGRAGGCTAALAPGCTPSSRRRSSRRAGSPSTARAPRPSRASPRSRGSATGRAGRR